MPWKLILILEARTRFVLALKARLNSFAALCHQFAISRQAGYKWGYRYQREGLKTLENKGFVSRIHFDILLLAP